MRSLPGIAGWFALVAATALLSGYAAFRASGNGLVGILFAGVTAWVAMDVLERRMKRSARKQFRALGQSLAGGQQAVIVEIPLSDASHGSEDEREGIHRIADRLAAAVDRDEVGEYDGDEFGAGVCRLFFHGPDCDALASTVQRVLQEEAMASLATVVKRSDPPGSREARTSSTV